MSSTLPRNQPGSWEGTRDIAAGVFLIALAAGAYAASSGLPIHDAGAVGPGLMPKGVAALTGVFGVLILVIGVVSSNERIAAMSLRGPLFVLGSVAVFAATIRPLGLAIAGPLAVVISACADRQVRFIEIIVFAFVMSALCIGLFKFLLRLPIPLAPLILGY